MCGVLSPHSQSYHLPESPIKQQNSVRQYLHHTFETDSSRASCCKIILQIYCKLIKGENCLPLGKLQSPLLVTVA